MAVNASEAYLTSLSERTFLQLWSYPNPFRAPGKEIADLLVVFGNDLIVFSDKASSFKPNKLTLAWSRWYGRTVAKSVKQLAGAVRTLTDPMGCVFVDDLAMKAFPFSFPTVENRRLHLIAVTHPDHTPSKSIDSWPGLIFDADVDGPEQPFHVGKLLAKKTLVHLFDGKSLENILTELDTIADFVGYLERRQAAIEQNNRLVFKEEDLLALSLSVRNSVRWEPIPMPLPDVDGVIRIPLGLWDLYRSSDESSRREITNRQSYTIDKLIEHFHTEYVEGRFLHHAPQTFDSHEQALRLLASESRFGRRIISNELYDILDEQEQHTFWASTVTSRDVPGLRYVWLTYPAPPAGVHIDDAERYLIHHLKEHIYVARSLFQADVILGIALPNREAAINSILITVFDGTKWNDEAQIGAESLRTERGIFGQLVEMQRHHVI